MPLEELLNRYMINRTKYFLVSSFISFANNTVLSEALKDILFSVFQQEYAYS